ncbi:MAG: transketolase C-terminal domain-containing protein [Anaerolineae bacterium]|nr:transketolase C-terminal domain-containing protein [Anaerolineae bacterium]
MPLGELAGLEPATQLRNVFGQALLQVCREEPRVVVLDGDLGSSTGAHAVRREFPQRFFNLGIAESNMVGVAAGLAACGYIPFVVSLSSFLLCNAYDQIRVSVCIAGLNVKLAGSHSGLTTGREGPSSMSIEDYALAGGLPNMVILVPSDPACMRWAVRAAAQHVGPVYVRSSREALPHIYPEGYGFALGKASAVREGRDVTLVACGLMVAAALDAAVLLERDGIEARVLDVHTLRPLDTEAIAAAARETGAIVTAEEHLVRGGLGSLVAQAVVGTWPVPVRHVGLDDVYSVSGSVDELMARYGLTAQHIAAAARQAIAARRR